MSSQLPHKQQRHLELLPNLPTWLWALITLMPLAAIAWHPLANNDLPMHLAIGEYVLAHGIPASDPFSFIAQGKTWVPHEWLSAVLFTWFEHAGGAPALIGLTVALSLGIGALAYSIARQLAADIPNLAVWSLPVWITLGPRLMLRPQLLFLLGIFGIWTLLLRARTDRRWLYGCLPIILFWINSHGSYPLAYAIVGAELFRRSDLEARWRLRFAAMLALTMLGQAHAYVLGNPFAGWQHTLGLLRDPVFMREIQEWISPFHSESFQATYGYWLAFPMLAISLGLAWRQHSLPSSKPNSVWPWTYWVFIAGSALLYFRHQRFAGLLALSALPVLATLPIPPAIRRFCWVIPLAATLALAIFGLPVSSKLIRKTGHDWDSGPWRMPLVEIEVLRDQYYDRGGVLCEYQYGGAISWLGKSQKSEARLRPTMDSRNSVYGAELYRLHRAALEVDNLSQEQLNSLRLNPKNREMLIMYNRARTWLEQQLTTVCAVLIASPELNPNRGGLWRRLDQDPDWQRLQFPASVIRPGPGPTLFVRIQ